MKIETLGDLLKAPQPPRLRPVSPLHARAMVYEAMGNYAVAAAIYSEAETGSPEQTTQELGALVYTLAIDARAHLTPAKLALLTPCPLVEATGSTGPDRQALATAIDHTWGGEDILIRRLSGGLYGSYVQALVSLKPHARALGIDLATAATTYIKSL